jgi:hypothetical protein
MLAVSGVQRDGGVFIVVLRCGGCKGWSGASNGAVECQCSRRGNSGEGECGLGMVRLLTKQPCSL